MCVGTTEADVSWRVGTLVKHETYAGLGPEAPAGTATRSTPLRTPYRMASSGSRLAASDHNRRDTPARCIVPWRLIPTKTSGSGPVQLFLPSANVGDVGYTLHGLDKYHEDGDSQERECGDLGP